MRTVLVIFIISLTIFRIYKYYTITESDIEELTNKWIEEVTNNDPEAVYNLFCKDGNLVGTVSQVKRSGIDIKRYFDYFALLPGISVINKKYKISKVDKNVFINTAFITWSWDGLKEPIVARMTFVYRGRCIFQLHSSKLPHINDSLLQINELN